jgi:hypothetical protein
VFVYTLKSTTTCATRPSADALVSSSTAAAAAVDGEAEEEGC